jgi:hypothetical protein
MPRSRFLWDVFVSHSSAQKPLVRAIVQQWRQFGLGVFFDEDTVQPAEDVITALNRACEKSRHTVLMITPEAMASKWVREEMTAAGYLSAAAKQSRLIPVLLKPLAEAKIPLNIRKLDRVDLTDPTTQRNEYHRLLRSLGIPVDKLADLPGVETETPAKSVSALPDPVVEYGPMQPSSPWYIEREADRRIFAALKRPGTTVTIRGRRQLGKSSLLSRLNTWGAKSKRATCVVDFHALDGHMLANSEGLFRGIAQLILWRLKLDGGMEYSWTPDQSLILNLTRFFEERVLARMDMPLLLLFDAADLVFPHATVCDDLFLTLRFWDSQRAYDLEKKTWSRVGIVIAHSTDPALWIGNVNHSPFNVGLQIELDDFDKDEVSSLNELHRRPLRTEGEIAGLMVLVGGHPHLVRSALYTMETRPCLFEDIRSAATSQGSPFYSHLTHLSRILYNDESLRVAFRKILRYGRCEDEMLFQRFWSVGLIRGEGRGKVALRYQIYEDYFRQLRL